MAIVGNPDEELARRIAAARSGSPEALGELLAGCRSYLTFVANLELNSALRSKVSPSDAVQEAFYFAHRDFAAFVGSSEQELLGWLRQILINNVLSTRRKYCKTQARDIAREVSLDDSQAPHVGNPALMHVETPSQFVLAGERVQSVERVLSNLPADYEQVLRLRYWEKLSLAEIAEQMGRTPEAVQKLWLRAVERFKREVRADGGV
jgi:RNA polymerase sigma-70 factor (ECF subfamily)